MENLFDTPEKDYRLERKVLKLREKIQLRQAELKVETRHDEFAHWYYIPEYDRVVGSVTAEHRNIKDPSIRNFEINEAFRFFKSNFEQITLENLDEFIERAKEAPILVRDNAGSLGNYIHDARQIYFQRWIDSGKLEKPAGTVEDIARKEFTVPVDFQSRVYSGCAAVDLFLKETGYIPLATELFVYDDSSGGTLDDIGLMPFDAKYELVLCDLKSSNQFKDTYVLQVMRYKKMFIKLYHLRPKRTFILKSGKEDRTYKLEWFREDVSKHGTEANKYLIKFNYHWELLREARKPKVNYL